MTGHFLSGRRVIAVGTTSLRALEAEASTAGGVYFAAVTTAVAILGAFIKMMGVYPPGSTVQLTDDRYAMVMAVNSTRPLKPNVIVHDAATPRAAAASTSIMS